jgi:hypothetical protein
MKTDSNAWALDKRSSAGLNVDSAASAYELRYPMVTFDIPEFLYLFPFQRGEPIFIWKLRRLAFAEMSYHSLYRGPVWGHLNKESQIRGSPLALYLSGQNSWFRKLPFGKITYVRRWHFGIGTFLWITRVEVFVTPGEFGPRYHNVELEEVAVAEGPLYT